MGIRPAVERFALTMEKKLKTKDEERGPEGWLNHGCTIKFLKERLAEEQEELDTAFDDCHSEELMAECVDVANFAMMIFDKLLAQKEIK